MTKEWIYTNAPLVEVIAEIHWQLIPLSTMPGAAVDPYYDAASEALTQLLKAQGYRSLERIVPAEVPRELVANQPTHRFRSEPNKWPLYQFGPGLFTVNIVAPYGGWSNFVPVLRKGIETLLGAYPLADRTMKITSAHLRYVDAFNKNHGFESVPQFLSEGLGVSVAFPDKFGGMFSKAPESFVLNYEGEAPKPSKSKLQLVAGTGKNNNEDVMVMQVGLTGPTSDQTPNSEMLMSWFEDAHHCLSEVFDSLTTAQLKERMGPKKELA